MTRELFPPGSILSGPGEAPAAQLAEALEDLARTADSLREARERFWQDGEPARPAFEGALKAWEAARGILAKIEDALRERREVAEPQAAITEAA